MTTEREFVVEGWVTISAFVSVEVMAVDEAQANNLACDMVTGIYVPEIRKNGIRYEFQDVEYCDIKIKHVIDMKEFDENA